MVRNDMAFRPPPPSIALACLAVAFGLHWLLPTPTFAPRPWNFVSAAALVTGAAVIVVPAMRRFVAKKTTFQPWKQGEELSALVVEGPYRWSRNPMYVALAVVTLGLACLVGTAVMLVAPILFIAILDRWVIPWEERALTATFGDAYLAYKSRVRRWL